MNVIFYFILSYHIYDYTVDVCQMYTYYFYTLVELKLCIYNCVSLWVHLIYF